MISEAIKKKLLKNYPVKDGHRLHHALYPIEINGEWLCAKVLLPTGHQHIEANDPSYTHFKTEEQAKKGCDAHNKFTFGSIERAQVIIDESFANA